MWPVQIQGKLSVGTDVLNEFICPESVYLREFSKYNFSNEHLTAPPQVPQQSTRNSAPHSLASSRESSSISNPGNGPYRLTKYQIFLWLSCFSIALFVFFRVLMMGAPAVGKSSLVSQFMTSEYLHAYDTSIGKCRISEIIQKYVHA